MNKFCWLAFVFMGCSDPITTDLEADSQDNGNTADLEDSGPMQLEEPAGLSNPTIRNASADCLSDQDSVWKFRIVADDPQGNNTLKSEANCSVYPVGATDEEAVQQVSIECNMGVCSTEYDGYPDSVLCEEASNWEFHFTIMDEDGYESQVEVVMGSAT